MSKVRNLAVLTSGGDAPGMNACIRSIVRAALYHNITPYGVYDGFNGLLEGNFKEFEYHDVSNILNHGGTILGTARCKDFYLEEKRKEAFSKMAASDIDALVVIGGDGSFRGAQLLAQENDIKVIGIPGTIDNDINGTDYTIGFDTACNTITENIDRIRDTAASHNRIFLVEVMGNNSGILALNTAAASGAEEVFMPEKNEDLVEIKGKIERAIHANKSCIVVIAEGDQFGGAKEVYNYLKEFQLEEKIRVSVLGHLQRGGSPSFQDRLYAALFGELAIVELVKGNSNLMVGLMNGNVSTCSLDLASEVSAPKNMDYLKLIRKLSIY